MWALGPLCILVFHCTANKCAKWQVNTSHVTKQTYSSLAQDNICCGDIRASCLQVLSTNAPLDVLVVLCTQWWAEQGASMHTKQSLSLIHDRWLSMGCSYVNFCQVDGSIMHVG